MTAAGVAAGEELIVVTSRRDLKVDEIPIKNFRPIGEFELPEYELQRLSFPPILQILDYVQREQFTEIIISTPGPIGLTGLLAAKMLNLQTSGIYHTDIPEYVRILTEDRFLESLAWSYMHWLYGQVDTVFVNSEQYRKCWIDRGFAPEKLKILPRGLDTDLFNPAAARSLLLASVSERTEATFACSMSAASRAKKISMCWRPLITKFARQAMPVKLFIVGHGPYSEALAATLPDAVFLGYLTGEPLATAYASADIFVFPSTTDTFGNVIIEAQASGLPVIVSDLGGPKELVEDWSERNCDESARNRRRGTRDHSPGERRGKCEREWARKRARAWSIGAGRTRFASSGIRPNYKFHTIYDCNLH